MGKYHVDRKQDLEDRIDTKSDRTTALRVWIRNHLTVKGALSECTTTAQTVHDESGTSCTLKVDNAAISGYFDGVYFAVGAATNVTVHTSATASPFDFANDIVDVVVACYLYDDSGTIKIGGLIGTADLTGDAVAPTDEEIATALSDEPFIRIDNVTFVASSTSACAFGSVESVALPTVDW